MKDSTFMVDNPEQPSVRIAAIGDLAFHGKVYESLTKNGPLHLFRPALTALSTVDICIANLETVLVDSPYSVVSLKAHLISDSIVVKGMKAAGIDIVTFANNHTMDGGRSGLQETKDAVLRSGIDFVGAGMNEMEARRSTTCSRNGVTIRVHAYSYRTGQTAKGERAGCAEALLTDIVGDLEEFHREGEICIVSLHAGAEFQDSPSPARIRLCRKIADAGAHVVLCHHPHVLQGIELHNNSLIAYSLGNYVTAVSDYMRSYSDECHLSMQLNIDVTREGLCGASVVPLVIDGEGRPHIARGEDRKSILQLLAKRSSLLSQSELISQNYRKMIRLFVRSTLLSLFWCVRKKRWAEFRLIFSGVLETPDKRRWIRDFIRRA